MSSRSLAPRKVQSVRSLWSDRGVKVKVLAAVAVAAVVAAIVGVLGLVSLSSAADRTQTLYRVNMQGTVKARSMRGAMKDLRVANRDLILAPDQAMTEAAATAKTDAENRFTTGLTRTPLAS